MEDEEEYIDEPRDIFDEIEADALTVEENNLDETSAGNVNEGETSEIIPVPKRRVVKNPRLKFDPDRLCGERGIPIVVNHFKDVKFKGKGHETEDLDKLLSTLEHWTHRLFPSMKFEDCLLQIEKLGKKRPVQTCLGKIRMDMPILNSDFGKIDEEDDVRRGVESDTESVGMEFDRLVQEYQQTLEEPEAEEIDTPDDLFPPNPSSPLNSTNQPPTSVSNNLTEEQRLRMEHNRKLAAERLKARLSNLNSCLSKTTDSVTNENSTVIDSHISPTPSLLSLEKENSVGNKHFSLDDSSNLNSDVHCKINNKRKIDSDDDELDIDDLVENSVNNESYPKNTESSENVSKLSSGFDVPKEKLLKFKASDEENDYDEVDIDNLVESSINDESYPRSTQSSSKNNVSEPSSSFSTSKGKQSRLKTSDDEAMVAGAHSSQNVTDVLIKENSDEELNLRPKMNRKQNKRVKISSDDDDDDNYEAYINDLMKNSINDELIVKQSKKVKLLSKTKTSKSSDNSKKSFSSKKEQTDKINKTANQKSFSSSRQREKKDSASKRKDSGKFSLQTQKYRKQTKRLKVDSSDDSSSDEISPETAKSIKKTSKISPKLVKSHGSEDSDFDEDESYTHSKMHRKLGRKLIIDTDDEQDDLVQSNINNESNDSPKIKASVNMNGDDDDQITTTVISQPAVDEYTQNHTNENLESDKELDVSSQEYNKKNKRLKIGSNADEDQITTTTISQTAVDDAIQNHVNENLELDKESNVSSRVYNKKTKRLKIDSDDDEDRITATILSKTAVDDTQNHVNENLESGEESNISSQIYYKKTKRLKIDSDDDDQITTTAISQTAVDDITQNHITENLEFNEESNVSSQVYNKKTKKLKIDSDDDDQITTTIISQTAVDDVTLNHVNENLGFDKEPIVSSQVYKKKSKRLKIDSDDDDLIENNKSNQVCSELSQAGNHSSTVDTPELFPDIFLSNNVNVQKSQSLLETNDDDNNVILTNISSQVSSITKSGTRESEDSDDESNTKMEKCHKRIKRPRIDSDDDDT